MAPSLTSLKCTAAVVGLATCPGRLFHIQSAEGRKVLSRVPDLGAQRLRADLASLCIGGWFVVWCMDSGAVVGVRFKNRSATTANGLLRVRPRTDSLVLAEFWST